VSPNQGSRSLPTIYQTVSELKFSETQNLRGYKKGRSLSDFGPPISLLKGHWQLCSLASWWLMTTTPLSPPINAGQCTSFACGPNDTNGGPQGSLHSSPILYYL
jgi:hypothetical protein